MILNLLTSITEHGEVRLNAPIITYDQLIASAKFVDAMRKRMQIYTNVVQTGVAAKTRPTAAAQGVNENHALGKYRYLPQTITVY